MGTQFLKIAVKMNVLVMKCKSFFPDEKTEVEQKLWTDVMGYNPSEIKGDSYPVTNVSFYEAVQFCNTLVF